MSTEVKAPDVIDMYGIKALAKPQKMWHTEYEIDTPYYQIRIKGMETGCGLMQITRIAFFFEYGYIHETTDPKFIKIKATLDHLIPKLKLSGVGALVATLGKSHFAVEPLFKALGFERISEYPNYRHGRGYNQRLYILKIP